MRTKCNKCGAVSRIARENSQCLDCREGTMIEWDMGWINNETND